MDGDRTHAIPEFDNVGVDVFSRRPTGGLRTQVKPSPARQKIEKISIPPLQVVPGYRFEMAGGAAARQSNGRAQTPLPLSLFGGAMSRKLPNGLIPRLVLLGFWLRRDQVFDDPPKKLSGVDGLEATVKVRRRSKGAVPQNPADRFIVAGSLLEPQCRCRMPELVWRNLQPGCLLYAILDLDTEPVLRLVV